MPVVVFVPGGWWKAQRALEYGGHLCAALRAEGIATWSLEYRRVGHEGGGWPGTFQDVAVGFNHLEQLARSYLLDLTRVVAVGHSDGSIWPSGWLGVRIFRRRTLFTFRSLRFRSRRWLRLRVRLTCA